MAVRDYYGEAEKDLAKRTGNFVHVRMLRSDNTAEAKAGTLALMTGGSVYDILVNNERAAGQSDKIARISNASGTLLYQEDDTLKKWEKSWKEKVGAPVHHKS